MRILLALSVIFISIQYGRCKIDLKRDKEVIIDIDSPELHQSQYHTADFDTSAYNYGYAVEPNGQFHHETRGGDGVTYGCYGYIDSDDLLKVTHYVADSQGYRTLEHEKPVLVYPIDENNVDAYEKHYKPKGVMLDWKDLYFPIGCGMAKGGVLLNAPVIRAPGGNFQQLGETKFPVQPSSEPKVVVPRIPFNSGIKTEPTKLIPISTFISPDNKQQDPKTTASTILSSSKSVNPSTQTTQRQTIIPSFSTKSSNIDAPANGPEYDTQISYRQNQRPTSTEPSIISTSHPSRSGVSSSPFRESINVNGPSTAKAPTDTLKLEKVKSPDHSVGQGDYAEELLPPFRTTIFDTQTTVGLPISSFDSGNDISIINSYAHLNPESRITTQSGYVEEELTTTVPIQSQTFSNNFNIDGPSTYYSFKPPGFTSTERISTIRPHKYDEYNFNVPTTTDIPIDFVTEPNPDSANPDSTTVLSADRESSAFSVDGLHVPPYTNEPSKDISYQTPVKFSSNQHESTRFGVGSSTASQRPVAESYTTPNTLSEFGTSTSPATYPGIGDYSKPKSEFQFNLPTKAPNQVSPVNTQFVTNSNVDPVKNSVTPKTSVGVSIDENEEPIYDNVDKTTKFTNGPHGAEYQLGSRNPHSPFVVNNGRNNNFNFLNPIKQSRKDGDANNPPISLITPLTHLTISGSFPSNTPTETSQPTPFVPSTDTKSSTPILPDSQHVFDSSPGVSTPYRPNTIQAERVPNRPSEPQHSGFFTVTTPKNEPSRGIITHMNAISQTRIQPDRVTPSLTSVTPNEDSKSNDLNFNPPANYFTGDVQHNIRPDVTTRGEIVKSTEYPFLYTRSRTTPSNIPYPDESSTGSSSPDSIAKTPSEELTIYSAFGKKIPPGTNPATTSFTAYNPGSSTTRVDGDGVTPSTDQRNSYKPVPYENLQQQPKFVLRPTGRPAINSNRQPLPNFNGYPDAELRNANFYPDSNPQKVVEPGDTNRNNIQPETKYVNTKKEFVPPYNPSSTPIPGSLGTAIGVYPPNVEELVPEIPNFNIAISKWPFYILPFPFTSGNIMAFPFTNGNVMSFPFLNGLPFQLGANVLPTANINTGTNVNAGSDFAQEATSVGIGGNGAPAQSICSWLSSFIKPKDNATNTETPTNENGETLQISNLQVNIKNPQLQINQNQVPFGIVGFIPIIAVPNCQHNMQGGNVDTTSIPTSIQLPSLCSQLSHLFGSQINAKETNQPLQT